MKPYLLLTPGPLTTSETVKEAMMTDWCTWDADYNVHIVEEIRKSLVALATTATDEYTSVLLQGSGTYCRVVGQKKAREIWFLCRKYNAQEALEMGLVNKVVPLEQLEDEYVQWAEEMMQLSPLALRMIKAGLNAELDGQSGIQELAGDATLLYYLTDEAQEGKNAFLEKRKPNFKQYPKFP